MIPKFHWDGYFLRNASFSFLLFPLFPRRDQQAVIGGDVIVCKSKKNVSEPYAKLSEKCADGKPLLRGLNIRKTGFHVKQKSTRGPIPGRVDFGVRYLNPLWFYSLIVRSFRQPKHPAQRGVGEARSDGNAARPCSNTRPRNSSGAITLPVDQEPGCSPAGSFPTDSV